MPASNEDISLVKRTQQVRDWWPVLSMSFGCLVGANAIDMADGAIMPSMMKAVESSMGMSPTAFGYLGIARAVSSALACPLWARLADTGDRRLLMAGACCLWGVATCLCAFATTTWRFTLLIVFTGIALTSMGPIVQSVVPDISPPEQRGRMFAVLQATGNAGCVVCAMIVTPAAQRTLLGIEGWRFAFLAIGVISLAYSLIIVAYFEEPRSDAKLSEQQGLPILQTYWNIVRCKTWCLICLQGIFGSIPYSALAFLIMWLQYLGFSDLTAAAIFACSTAGGIAGALLAGAAGDWASILSPNHGRIWVAVVADVFRPPLLLALFILCPKFQLGAHAYGLILFSIGFLCPWPSIGCNKPIFTEVVPESARASVIAAQTVVERCFGSIGGLLVGYVSQQWYGYSMHAGNVLVSEMSVHERQRNASALGDAMLVTTVGPWVTCTVLYLLVHLTYKHDRDSARNHVSVV